MAGFEQRLRNVRSADGSLTSDFEDPLQCNTRSEALGYSTLSGILATLINGRATW